MNDFEQRLARQPFRAPPPELRAEILQAAAATELAAKPGSRWRDMLWPSPWAWGALAALWLVFAAIEIGEHRSADHHALTALAPLAPAPRDPAGPLVSVYTMRDFNDVLDLAK
jgi:hypothetical protein